MLVKGINDSEEEIEKISDFISGLRPGESYISIPTRPPAEKKAGVPDENVVNRAYQIFTGKGINAGYLIGYEGNAFAFTGDVKKDILSITSVHPMKEEAVIEFLNKAGEKMDVVEALISEGSLKKVSYRGQSFYMRKLQI
jgi:wyosine [tRNA(Phe)-imidazoG37] synthetase (radical SAM superfamily)